MPIKDRIKIEFLCLSGPLGELRLAASREFLLIAPESKMAAVIGSYIYI